MEKLLPVRKHPRLKTFDYSSTGAYFITICTENRKCIFSTVGRGLAPAENTEEAQRHTSVAIALTKFGIIAKEEIDNIHLRFDYASITHCVIMPNHIHLILELKREAAGASPRPTVNDIICAYKSLVTKRCKENGYKEKIFQTSFYEHVIRNEFDYDETAKYIYDNPDNWFYDELYQSESN